MTSAIPGGPFNLVTVNNAPERAESINGHIIEEVKGEFYIYVTNVEGMINC